MKQILFLLTAVTLLAACHKNKEEEEQGPAMQTVLVYIAADNNLNDSYYDSDLGRTTSFVTEDIEEMMEGSKRLTNQQKLILFVDRKGEKPYFMSVANGDTTRLFTYTEELKSSDAATLGKAMKWVMEKYEAQNYGLVLWGHADGWIIEGAKSRRQAYGQDVSGGKAWMDIPDMAKELENVLGTKRLRFIFADCCCFQSVESDYELRKTADYIIASAAEIPGVGAPYDTVLPALFSQADDFGQQAIKAYYNQVASVVNYNGTISKYREPMTVVKTSEMENLAQATRTALVQSLLPLESDEKALPNVKGLIYYYNGTLFDMNDFLLRIAPTEVYAQWKRSFDAAIPYKTMTTVWMANYVAFQDPFTQMIFSDFEVTEERYGGVNMFVMQDPAAVNEKYRNGVKRQNDNINKMQWYDAAGLSQLGW